MRPPGGDRTVRIVAITGPDAGHVLPVASVAVALAERGHEVSLGTGAGWREPLEAAGVGWFELPLLAATPEDVDFGFRLYGRAREMAPPLADLVRDRDPDLLLVDVLTVAGAFAADLVGAPWVEISPHVLYDPDPLVPPVGLGARRPRTVLGRRDQQRTRAAQSTSVAAGARLRDEARVALGLQPGNHPRARLLATLPALEYPRATWPEAAYVVGPLDWEPDWPDLAPPPGDRPLVVITDSTATTVDDSLVAQALTGLADADVRVVATTDAAYDGPRPRRLVVGKGSHARLFRQADVVVCPGGHGAVVKALAGGVPVVIAPMQGDQRETARRVVATGAGRRVAWGPRFPARLAWAVRRVLADPAYRRAAARVAGGARGLGADHAARIVERVAAEVTSRR